MMQTDIGRNKGMEINVNNLYKKLEEYSRSDYYGFHMPGHKRNKNTTGAGLPYEIDITEIKGFDDLHHAKGMLKQAQERAAKVFHGEETCFLVNGSTVGILSAILGCTSRGDRILMARNCHKSVYHAVYMNELEPEYVYPSFCTQKKFYDSCSTGTDSSPLSIYTQVESHNSFTHGINGSQLRLNGEIRPEEIRNILERDRLGSEYDGTRSGYQISGMNDGGVGGDQTASKIERKRIRAVVITSPTYDGIVSDVEKIAWIVHSYGIPLIVDEAHGAHFGFHPYFPENANTRGADVVIHSIHKTLPSLTQTALIHMNGELADRENIKKYLHILQTSSPSYVLMAGIDACIDWLCSEKKDILFEQYVDMLKETRKQLKKMKHLQIVETEHFDYSKIVISVSGTKYFGRELYTLLLDQYHLQMEMAAGDYVLAMTSVGDTKEGFQRLVQALEEIDSKLDEENHSFYISMGRINPDQPSMGIKAEEDCTENGKIEPMRQKSAGLPRLEQVFTSSGIEYIAKENKEKIRMLPWESCAGYISMEYAYLYPPGIPLVVPGERISEEIMMLIREYHDMGFEINGLIKDGYINVYLLREDSL